MKSRYSILIIVVFLIAVSLYSCKGDVKSKNESIEESQKEVDDIQLAKNSLLDFYSYLNKENYEECINYFSKHLRESPGDEILKLGLVQRQERIGETKNSEINYSFVETNIDDVKLFVFHTKCFNNDADFHFENITIIEVDGKYLISNYEYGNLPYVSKEEANDKISSLNMYLAKMYEAINTDDFEKVYTFVDEKIIDRLGKEKLKQGFEREIAQKFEITNFKVESVEARFEESIPVVDMTIKETSSRGVTKSTVILIVRAEGYKVMSFKDIPVVSSSEQKELSQEDADRINNYATYFYDALRKSDYNYIISFVDSNVFINNDKESVKKSFENRNVYYGLPISNEMISYKKDKILERESLILQLNVKNASGKNSQEKIVLIKLPDGGYRIYGYEYAEIFD
jgi:hypothetical protein